MANIRSRETASPEKGWRDLAVFWGKARPPVDRPSPSYHPLIFHSLDVAAVGRVLLARWPGLAVRLAAALGLEVEAATTLLIRLLALHDLGKFARRFQAKSPEHYDPNFGSSTSRRTTTMLRAATRFCNPIPVCATGCPNGRA